jgi:uncharacterized repeat protein (TIGR03987 family)
MHKEEIMNPILINAVAVVTFALIFYSIAVILEQRKKRITNLVLVFFSLGVLFDISSTTLMIIGSHKIPITVHGFIGYSALIVMVTDAILIFRFRRKNGDDEVPRDLNVFTRIAYAWWVVAYIAGAVIAMTMKN